MASFFVRIFQKTLDPTPAKKWPLENLIPLPLFLKVKDPSAGRQIIALFGFAKEDHSEEINLTEGARRSLMNSRKIAEYRTADFQT